MPPTDVISIIIQGGAVGLLLVFGFGVYKLVWRLIDMGNTLVANHLSHLTATLEEVNATLVRLDSSIQGCPARKKDAS
jgi:hypothetical protein